MARKSKFSKARAASAANARKTASASKAAKQKRAKEVAELKAAEAAEEARDVEVLDAPTRKIMAEVVEEIVSEKEKDHERLVAGMEALERTLEANVDGFVAGLSKSDQKTFETFATQMKSKFDELNSVFDEVEVKYADLESESTDLKSKVAELESKLSENEATFKQAKVEHMDALMGSVTSVSALRLAPPCPLSTSPSVASTGPRSCRKRSASAASCATSIVESK